VAVKAESGDPAKFEALVKRVKDRLDGKGIVLMSEDPNVLAAGSQAVADRKRCFTPPPRPTRRHGQCQKFRASGVKAAIWIAVVATKTAAGLKDLVLDAGQTPRKALEDQIVIRRAA
jgi:CO dehydrogenase/acetyl-CoA synthase gamma subunit (corrinoid Fe-S protein)